MFDPSVLLYPVFPCRRPCSRCRRRTNTLSRPSFNIPFLSLIPLANIYPPVRRSAPSVRAISGVSCVLSPSYMWLSAWMTTERLDLKYLHRIVFPSIIRTTLHNALGARRSRFVLLAPGAVFSIVKLDPWTNGLSTPDLGALLSARFYLCNITCNINRIN